MKSVAKQALTEARNDELNRKMRLESLNEAGIELGEEFIDELVKQEVEKVE